MGIGSAIVLGVCIILAAAIITDAISFTSLVNAGLSLIIYGVIFVAAIIAVIAMAYAAVYIKDHIRWR